MANNTALEEIMNIHPLDKVGNDINEILQLKGSQVIETSGSVTICRSITIGDVSIFFARYNSLGRDTFTVGLEELEGDDFTPLSDDFVWDIHRPENSPDTLDDIEKLGLMVRKVGCLAVVNGEA